MKSFKEVITEAWNGQPVNSADEKMVLYISKDGHLKWKKMPARSGITREETDRPGHNTHASLFKKDGPKPAWMDRAAKMRKEEVEQIDEIQINWSHKTQKYHTIKHPDGSHWGVFDHSSYGTKGHEIRKIRDSEGNAIKASDSRRNHSSGYKSGMGSPSEAAKEWAKKHGGTITNHKIKEETDRPGLWANIHAKRKRIEAGSGERMRKPGSKGAPTAQDFKSASVKEENEEWDEMTRSELKIALNSAHEILELMDKGAKIERWQVSEITKASEGLSTVYNNLCADNEELE